MSYVRQDVKGTTPQDIKRINDNTMALFQKVFGDINLTDITDSFLSKVTTQWIPVQGEGNFDSSYPLYIRFYVPPNTKKITSAKMNMQLSRYRMDSSVATSDGTPINISGSISTSEYSFPAQTYPVEKWGLNVLRQVPAPGRALSIDDFATIYWNYIVTDENPTDLGNFGAGAFSMKLNGYPSWYTDGSTTLDLYDFNHVHKVVLPPHTHDSAFSGSAAGHEHALNEGIKVSGSVPQGVSVKINGTEFATLTGDNAVANEIDIAGQINIGQWNTIECTTSNLARITLYGTIELQTKLYVEEMK